MSMTKTDCAFSLNFVSAEPLPTFKLNPIDGRISSLQYIGKNVVVVQTSDKFSYVSVDQGVNFYNLNQLLKTCEEYKCIDSVVKHPTDTNLFVLLSSQKNSQFICTNLNSLTGPQEIDKLSCVQRYLPKSTLTDDDSNSSKNRYHHAVLKYIFHPIIHDTILVLMSDHTLYISYNLGANFFKLKSGVKSISFANKESRMYSDTLLFGIKEIEDGTSYFFSMDSRNRNEEDNEIIMHPRDFMMYGQFLFVATTDASLVTANGQPEYVAKLYVSSDNGHSFNRVRITNRNGVLEKSFVILDGSEGAVFINVQQEQIVASSSSSQYSPRFGKVYLSDSRGVKYKESLWNNRKEGGHADFTKVKSLEGVYLANQVHTDDMGTVEIYDCNNCNGYEDCTNKCKTKSLITFDKMTWQYIQPPKVDAQGKPIQCSNCYLNIHGFTASSSSNYVKILSHKDAVGIILANGNVGQYLDSKIVNTYMSRDGGLSWFEIAKGSHLYEILNHGGILVTVKNNQPTVEIRYTLDEAETWITANFTDRSNSPYHISKLYVNEKHDPLAKYMIIHGSGDTTGDILIRADFSHVQERECNGINNPYDQNSDYEYFKPHSYSNNCFLGRVVEYTRRKRSAKCFNPQLTEDRPIKIKNCECTYADYDCDYGYDKKLNQDRTSFTCTALSPQLEEESKSPSLSSCQTERYYNESRGFARLPGNTCVGGMSSKLDPIQRDCPTSMSGWAIFILLLFFFFLVMFTVLLIYKHSSRLQALFNPNKMRYRYNQLINDMSASEGSLEQDIENNNFTDRNQSYEIHNNQDTFDNRIEQSDDEDFGLDVTEEEQEAPEELNERGLFKTSQQ
ncbi:hypothetical protein FDP41_011302 [Naegleria fowleri]|uniref:VPS10 domain-containing protein n=1 Tax=Naegleria fowleri TaxID=5763 RepID=A0A6A5C6A9_NAEFO|nr:uncharacterized protein FDP41_011302 [Naegleria fowleri]KAF0982372.1 hypothetical protein FDP41_011302 [Naegleria fowleri]